jgi:hypothetical protein
MAPSLATKRRRPLDPLTDIIGFSGGSLADQLDEDTQRRLLETLRRPTAVPLGGMRPDDGVVPPTDTPPVRPAIIPPVAQAIAPPIAPGVPYDYSAPAPPLAIRPPNIDAAAGPIVTAPTAISREQLAEIGAPPMVDTRGRRRPARIFIGEGDGEQREQAYADKVREFKPEKEGWKKGLLRTGLGFLTGGIPGAVGTLGMWALDRRAPDRAWQEQEIAEATKNLGGYRDQRRQGLQDRLLNEQVRRAENPLVPAPVDRTVGGNILRRQPDGSYAPVYTAPDKPQRPADGFTLGPGGRRYDASGKLIAEAPDRPARPSTTGQETPQQRSERVRKFRAAQKVFGDLSAQEQATAAKKDAAFARASTLRDWQQRGYAGLNGRVPENDDVEAAEKAAQQAQSAYEGYAEKKTKAQADMLQYGEVGGDGELREPTVTLPAAVGKYTGQRISRSKLGEAAKRLSKTEGRQFSESDAEAYLIREGAVIY